MCVYAQAAPYIVSLGGALKNTKQKNNNDYLIF